MKRIIALLLALALTGAAALAEEIALPNGQALPPNAPVTIDLDGDGADERVSWTMAPDEYDPFLALTVALADGTPLVYETPIIWDEAVYIADIDGDGAQEILLTGDEMSADYLTYCLRLSGGALVELLFPDITRGDNYGGYYPDGYGQVVAVGDDRLTLSGSQDVLGTWFGARTLALNAVGYFQPADDGWWVRSFDPADADLWEYGALVLKTSLPYSAEDGSPAGVLAPGDAILICASDKQSRARFVTREGDTGILSIARDEEQGWGWRVNGVPEADLFEYVPYAD